MKPIAWMWKSKEGHVKVTKTDRPKDFVYWNMMPVPLYTELKIMPDEWIDVLVHAAENMRSADKDEKTIDARFKLAYKLEQIANIASLNKYTEISDEYQKQINAFADEVQKNGGF